MRRPTKAILLSAGFGTRMRPVSWAVPKPLLPLWNRPLALRLLDMLAGWGVEEVLVNLHHGADAVFNNLRHAVARERLPLRIVFSFEADILGTGGALRRAEWFIGNDPFWLLNSDIAADVDPKPFLRAMTRHRPLSVLWMDDRIGPRTVETRAGRVVTFKSSNPGSEGTSTFCGMHLLSPKILRFLPDRPFSSIISAYEAAMHTGARICAINNPASFWRDLGTPAQYLEAHSAWAARMSGKHRQGARKQHSSVVAPTATVATGVLIENSVVMEGARITSGAAIRNAIIGPRAIVTRPVEGPVVRADLETSDAPPYAEVARALGWKPGMTTVNALAPRGSDRSFSRIFCGRHSAILIEYGTLRPENATYAGIARFLAAHGVRVPAVMLDWPDARVLAMEDAGDRSLESTVHLANAERVETLYRHVLESVVRLHGIPAGAARSIKSHLQQAFGPKVYRWERELFAHHFLGPRLNMDSSGQKAVLSDLARVGRHLASTPQVLVHRDLQSSNVFLPGGIPVLIDFQGMRFGPAAYDVASLLCDPYVMLSEGLLDRLLEYYLDRVPEPEHVRRLFWWAAVERLAQALGAFGRLSESPDTVRFANYIPPALRMMRRALSHLPALPHLSAAVAAAQDRFNIPRD